MEATETTVNNDAEDDNEDDDDADANDGADDKTASSVSPRKQELEATKQKLVTKPYAVRDMPEGAEEQEGKDHTD